jgi:hypothetical protein
MLAAQGLHWLDRQPQGPRWPSYGVAAAVTAALFAVAFISMRSVAPWSDTDHEPTPATTPIVVPLRPPPVTKTAKEVPVIPQPVAPPRTISKPIDRAPPITPSVPISPPIVAPIAPPIALPVAPRVAPDTSRPRDIGPQIPTVPILRHNSGLSDTAMAMRGGASYAPAGVTIASRTKNSAKLRDSIITEKLGAVSWANVPMSAATAGSIDQSQGQARMLAQRSTSVGMTNGLYVPMGKGVGGVGAVNGGKTGVTMDSRGVGVSIPFPLFSPGLSPEDRKRNEKLYAEYLAYLRREQEVILLKRDSIRVDSLRRDSLAKRRVIP